MMVKITLHSCHRNNEFQASVTDAELALLRQIAAWSVMKADATEGYDVGCIPTMAVEVE